MADFRATERNRMMEIAYRFAGFEEDPCPCATGLEPASALVGLQRLHLAPGPRAVSTTMSLEAPDLGAPDPGAPEQGTGTL